MNTPAPGSSANLKPNRKPLILLTILFLGPFIGATLMYAYFPDWRPKGTINKGELITPARPLPSLSFSTPGGATTTEQLLWGKWSLVYVGGQSCDETCADRLYMTRQVRIRTRERERLQRVYVAPDAASLDTVRSALSSQNADLVWAADTNPPGGRLSDFLGATDPYAIYLLDPHGNWLMIYRAGTQPADLLADLKKLLSLSQIG